MSDRTGTSIQRLLAALLLTGGWYLAGVTGVQQPVAEPMAAIVDTLDAPHEGFAESGAGADRTVTPSDAVADGGAPPSDADDSAEADSDSAADEARAIEGRASYYGYELAGRPTANGEQFDPERLTAAHRTLPFGTRLRVTNLRNGRSVVVRVNDRGPFVGARILDLSYGAAREIGMIRRGTADVRIDVLD